MHTRMTKLFNCLVLCAAIALAGCVFVDHKKSFEIYKNKAIGSIVDHTGFYKPHWIERVGSDRIEHRYKDYSGCSYAIEIDEKTRVILGWRYLSEPSLCWKHFPTA